MKHTKLRTHLFDRRTTSGELNSTIFHHSKHSTPMFALQIVPPWLNDHLHAPQRINTTLRARVKSQFSIINPLYSLYPAILLYKHKK